jgi:hypothetical protein
VLDDRLTLPSIEGGLDDDHNEDYDSQGQVGNSRCRVSQRSPGAKREDPSDAISTPEHCTGTYQAMKHKTEAVKSKDPKPPKT